MSRIRPPGGWAGHVLALLAGAVFPLGLAPLNFWWVIILSAAVLAHVLQDLSPRQAFVRAWWYGLGFWGAGASWVYVSIHHFGGTNFVVSVLLTFAFVALLGVFQGLQGYLYSALRLQRWHVVSFPALWVLMEWMRIWFLSGFPWLFAGYGFIDTPLKHYAPVTGVMGISFLVVMAGNLLLELHRRAGILRITPLVIGAVVVVGALKLQSVQWTYPDLKAPLKVALVQANIAQEMKWDPAHRENIIQTYTTLTTPLWGKADVVIWPEAAFPVFYSDALPLIGALDMQAEQAGSAFISGVPYWEPGKVENEITYYNSIFAAGQGSGIYHKQTLVPFGEYVPLEGLIRGLVPFFDLPMSSFTPGAPDQEPLLAKGFSFAPYICYEIVYPELVRQLGQQSDVLLTISNDAWFGRSFGPLQHFEMARMRALEMGRYLVRATNTGITAIVDPPGNVVSRLPSFEQGILTGEVYRTVGVTPFARWGYWPLLGLCGVLVLVSALNGYRSRSLDA